MRRYNEAWLLVEQFISDQHLRQHLLATQVIMMALAQRLDENELLWGLSGLLHDIDYELTQKTPERHGAAGADLLQRQGFEEAIVHAVEAHSKVTGTRAESLLDRALYVADPLSWVPLSYMWENGSLDGLTPELLLELLEDQEYAPIADRAQIKSSEELLSIALAELVQLAITALNAVEIKLEAAERIA